MSKVFRLILFPRVWQRQVPVLRPNGLPGTGLIRRNLYAGVCEFVADHVVPAIAAPAGRRFGPLDDILVVAVRSRIEGDAGARLLSEFAPLPGQAVVVLVVGHGPAAGKWSAAVFAEGLTGSLDRLTLVGPHMRTVSATERGPADPEALARWSRTRGALSDRVWARVYDTTAAIIGAGRNGSAASSALALLGVRRLSLIDADVLEAHNLDAGVGFAPAAVGKPKVLGLAEAALRVRPDDLAVTAIPRGLPEPTAAAAIRPADLVITCVDHDGARLAANRLAARWGKVHLDVGTGVFREGAHTRAGGDVRLMLPGEACVWCLGGLRDPAGAQYLANAPPGAMRRGPFPTFDQQRAGSLVTVNAVAVNIGVQLWLDLLAGAVTGSRWVRVEWRDGTPRLEMLRVGAGCERCRATPPGI